MDHCRQSHLLPTWTTRSATYRVLCAVVIAIVFALVGPGSTSAAEPFRMTPALAAQLTRLQCRIVGGKIRLTSRQIGGQMSSSTRGNGRVQEALALDQSSELPRLDYQVMSRDLRIRIAISAGEDVAISRLPGENQEGSIVEFTQQPEGGVELIWRNGTDSVRRSAPTVWHLWLAEPKICREELAPLLQLVRPGWDLSDQGPAVEAAIVDAAKQLWTDNWPRWSDLVAQLDDDQFSQRRAADRALRGAGLPVIPFLQGLDLEKLEPEQRNRIRRIVASLTRFSDEDSPDRVAVWLVGDPRIWLTLMSRDDLPTRRTAAAKLSEILGRPIEFDAAGVPETRREQIARLEAVIRDGRELGSRGQ